MSQRLPPFTADILREVMNIGGAHATTALAKLSHQRIDIGVPSVELLKIEEVPDYVGGTGDLRSMILHEVSGDVLGVILLSFSEEDAHLFTENIRMEHHLAQDGVLPMLQELGNIVSGSCFGAIAKFLDLHFNHSLPSAATDISGAILGSLLAEIGQRADDALITELSFRADTLKIDGRMFLLFDPDSTQSILSAAQKKIHTS